MLLKLSTSVVCAVVAVYLTLTGVKAVPAAPELATRASDAVCDTEHAAPFWGAYSAAKTDHFYSTDYTQVNGSFADGYELQARLGFIFREKTVSASIFLRLYNAKQIDNFYTTNETEADRVIRDDGYHDRGYRASQLYSSAKTDHFYTINETEAQQYVKNGYELQGIAGYILPNF
ncbi:hypothetical protein DAEQUDRAFT_736371 [Daedalea quercina L-15889]|uniref:DUF5648 domain-containing protein n=1 Tax=Daedalea quercina L-15889 TaxID=1314783 RepID=A0A165SDV4_9APHY|nr:hypothetical protein DAEQUDRAFT_736371 [Daedalea quercina L-15889]